jgi:hypothetical protein
MYSDKRQPISIASENGDYKVKYRTNIQYFNPKRQSGRKDETNVMDWVGCVYLVTITIHRKETTKKKSGPWFCQCPDCCC